MGRNVVVLVVTVMAVLTLHGVEGANYTVGGTVGWKIPPNGESTYSDWASDISFKIGDILVFNFETGMHDVAVVTKEDYDACNPSMAIDGSSSSPYVYSLDGPGDYYFICTKGSHCSSSGQKLAINVEDNSSSSPSSSPPGKSGSTTPPLKDNMASPSLAVTRLSLLIISMALSFVCF